MKTSKKKAARPPTAAPPPRPSSPWNWGTYWWLLLGIWAGLSIVKHGNPVILESLIPAPTSLPTVLSEPWPFRWGAILLVLLVLALIGFRWPLQWRRLAWPLWFPLAWLLWQGLAASQTVSPDLTSVTLEHFVVCVVVFYAARLGPATGTGAGSSGWLWGILGGFCLALFSGLGQHFGGLESAREYFFQQPDWKSYPTEYIKKISSSRIFGTLVYPNAFAGAILMFLPPLLVFLYRLTARCSNVVMGTIVGSLLYISIACLYWTESKAGWLLAMGLIGLCWLHSKISGRVKWIVVAIGLIVGSAAFFYRYADYFQRGATSVSARFDYWAAATDAAASHPVLGTGPGTFKVAYAERKRPESEMARLAHNDYLEQASDSGLFGFVSYLGIFPLSLALLYPRVRRDGLTFAVWLGLVGWALQGLVEFGLYIPGLAWPAFLMLGWLWAATSQPAPSDP